MKKINFEDLPSENTPINSANLDTLQDNIEESVVVVSSTEPQTKEKVWFQTNDNLFDINSKKKGFVSGSNIGDKVEITSNPSFPNAVYFNEIPINSSLKYSWSFSGYPNEYTFRIRCYDNNNITTESTITSPNANAHTFNKNTTKIRILNTDSELYPNMNGIFTQDSVIVKNKKILTKNSNGVFEEFYNEEKITKLRNELPFIVYQYYGSPDNQNNNTIRLPNFSTDGIYMIKIYNISKASLRTMECSILNNIFNKGNTFGGITATYKDGVITLDNLEWYSRIYAEIKKLP